MIQTEWLLYWHTVAVFLFCAVERASLSYKYLAGHLTASKKHWLENYKNENKIVSKVNFRCIQLLVKFPSEKYGI